MRRHKKRGPALACASILIKIVLAGLWENHYNHCSPFLFSSTQLLNWALFQLCIHNSCVQLILVNTYIYSHVSVKKCDEPLKSNWQIFSNLLKSYPHQRSRWGIQPEWESFAGGKLQTGEIRYSLENILFINIEGLMSPSEDNLHLSLAHFSCVVKENLPVLDFIFKKIFLP